MALIVINGINRSINGITRLIDSITWLINGWGPGLRPRAAAAREGWEIGGGGGPANLPTINEPSNAINDPSNAFD